MHKTGVKIDCHIAKTAQLVEAAAPRPSFFFGGGCPTITPPNILPLDSAGTSIPILPDCALMGRRYREGVGGLKPLPRDGDLPPSGIFRREWPYDM